MLFRSERLYDLISFIKENPPLDGELYQFLPIIEKKAGGKDGFMDLMLHHLFTHLSADEKGKKRLGQETVRKFIDEVQDWGIVPEVPYSHIKKSLFGRLQSSSGDLEQTIDDQTIEVYLYVKK